MSEWYKFVNTHYRQLYNIRMNSKVNGVYSSLQPAYPLRRKCRRGITRCYLLLGKDYIPAARL